MSEQMRCVYCGNVMYSRPYSCCGEVNHCEPVEDEPIIDADDQYAAVCESPSALWQEVGDRWDHCRVKLHGEDMPADKALVYLAHSIKAGETDMDVLRCIAGDVLAAMAECAKEAA